MPEKVHTKFGDDPIPSKPAGRGKEEKKSYSPKSSSPDLLAAAKGIKRAQDGMPKNASNNSSAPPVSKSNIDTQQAKPNPSLNTNSPKPKAVNGAGPKKPNANNPSSHTEQPTKKAKLNNDKSNFHHEQNFKKKAEELRKISSKLTIALKKPDLRWQLRHNDVMLVTGETGCGKSTQTPQFLYTEPWCKRQNVQIKNKEGREETVAVGGIIAITQPRRLAAITLAQRVAAEMASPLRPGQPGTVGYAVRFDSVQPPGMKIKFVTEGTLLQEMLGDPHLRKYSAIIVDEVHERSVDVDLICGFLRKIVHGDMKGRGGIPLKVVIMSATVDLGGLEAFFSKPHTVPDYEPGKNHGRIIADHIHDNTVALEDDTGIWYGEPRDETDVDAWKVRATAAYGAKAAKSLKAARTLLSDFDSASPNFAKLTAPSESKDLKHKKLTNGKRKNEDSKGEDTDGSHGTSGSFTSWEGFSDSNDDKSPTNTPSQQPPRKRSPKLGVPEEDLPVNGVAIEYVKGRVHDVVKYFDDKPDEDYVANMIENIFHVNNHQALPGDILCFLTGQDDIQMVKKSIEAQQHLILKGSPKIKVMPLYAALSAREQQACFEPVTEPKTRKVVLATNIAETSVTVPGIRYVIDCGFAKVKQYRPRLGMESLLIQPISRSASTQRMGRAGRETSGICWRLYTEEDYRLRAEDDIPEILRCDVIEAVLKMKARGVDNVLTFPLLDSPDKESLERALFQLGIIGALDENGNLTTIGKQMASFPLPALYGRVLIAAANPELDCVLEAIDIISCLTSDGEVFLPSKSEEENEVFLENRSDITRREGDLITLLTTMQRYAAENVNRNDWCQYHGVSIRAMKSAINVRKQLRNLCFKQKLLKEMPPPDQELTFEPISPERAELLLKAFLTSFKGKTAVLASDGSYRTLQAKHPVAIHPSSVMLGKKVEAIMFLEHVYTTKNYAKKISAVQAGWIVGTMGI